MNKQTNSEAVMRDALKMAIEYIEGGGGWGNASKNVIQACKEAIAENEKDESCLPKQN